MAPVERMSPWLALAIVACGGGGAEVKSSRPTGPSAAEVDLEQHKKLQRDLAASHRSHLAACAAFEQSKAEYLKELQSEVSIARAKPGTAQSLASMTTERIRIAEELRASQQMLDDALLARAGAQSRLLAVEAKLWTIEEEAFGGRARATARAEQEVKSFHDVETALHVAQKGQQNTVGLLAEAEFELNATVGDDVEKRDIADRRLANLREDLTERMGRLIEAAREYDRSAEQIHHRLMKQMDAARADRVKQLLIEREKAATSLSASRETLKAAMIKRAEDRAREISHDGEIAAVVDGAFRDGAARDALLARVRPKRDAASEARVAMQREEVAVGEVRRKLVTLEADIQALGY